MFVEPLLFVLMLFVKACLLVIRIVFWLCKHGFGWLVIGYFFALGLYNLEPCRGNTICMIVAWGGTAAHFLIKFLIHRKHEKAAVAEQN